MVFWRGFPFFGDTCKCTWKDANGCEKGYIRKKVKFVLYSKNNAILILTTKIEWLLNLDDRISGLFALR